MTRSTRAFFATALGALVVAAALHLAVLAGQWGAWTAMVHVTLFGWISAMIFGVSYHTMPVFSARRFPYPSLIGLHWGLFTAGVALATVALFLNWRAVLIGGLFLQLLSSLLFVANTILLFARGERGVPHAPATHLPAQARVDRVGTSATKLSALCLPLALLLLIGVYLGWIGGSWLLAAQHLAALGWIMLMIVGVALHVLPRFSGRGVRGPGWARAQLAFHSVALLLIVSSLGFGWRLPFALGGALMGGAVALFIWTVWPTVATVRSTPTLIQISFEEQRR
jgi:hypothetical protein